MSPTEKPASGGQTAIRHALLANGYTPLPISNKIPILRDWQKLLVTDGAIDKWANRKHGTRATGIRIDGQLVAIDIDIDHEEASRRVEEAICDIVPALYDAPLRFGKGHKVCFLLRLKEGEPKWGWMNSGSYAPQEVIDAFLAKKEDTDKIKGHAVEVFCSLSSRQIGAYGAHTTDDEGATKVRYGWFDDRGPLEVPYDELPEITRADLDAIMDTVKHILGTGSEEAPGMGWALTPGARPGSGAIETVYDLTDDLVFNCNDGHSRTLAQLEVYAREGRDPRCSASFMEAGKTDTTRCRVGLTHDGVVTVYDHKYATHHRPEAARKASFEELGVALATALVNSGAMTAEEFQLAVSVAGAGYRSKLQELHNDWVICVPWDRPYIRIADPDMIFGAENMRRECAPCELRVKNSNGKIVANVSPLQAFDRSPLAKRVHGVRFDPLRQNERIIEVDGKTLLNTYVPVTRGTTATLDEDVALFTAFLEYLLPREDERTWFLDMLSHKMRNPGVPGVGTLLVDPVGGTGKGILFDQVRGIVLPRYHRPVKLDQLVGTHSQSQYNEWLAGRLVITVDEVTDKPNGERTRVDERIENKLKEYVDPRPRPVEIVRKGLPNYYDNACATFLMATNSPRALAGIGPQDRRFVILRVTDQPFVRGWPVGEALIAYNNTPDEPRTRAYFSNLWHWLRTREIAADFSFTRAVDFGGKAEMIEAGDDELDEYVCRVIDSWPFGWAPQTLLADHVTELLRRDGKLNDFGTGRTRRIETLHAIRKKWGAARPAYKMNIGRKSPVDVVFRDKAEIDRVLGLPIPARDHEVKAMGTPNDVAMRVAQSMNRQLTAIQGGKDGKDD